MNEASVSYLSKNELIWNWQQCYTFTAMVTQASRGSAVAMPPTKTQDHRNVTVNYIFFSDLRNISYQGGSTLVGQPVVSVPLALSNDMQQDPISLLCPLSPPKFLGKKNLQTPLCSLGQKVSARHFYPVWASFPFNHVLRQLWCNPFCGYKDYWWTLTNNFYDNAQTREILARSKVIHVNI